MGRMARGSSSLPGRTSKQALGAAMPENASIERIGACVRRVDPLDFYFTLFADLRDGRRIDSVDEGRWYIDVELSGRDPEHRLTEAVGRELREFDVEERWSMLTAALRRHGTVVEPGVLEKTTFTVELDRSAHEWVRQMRSPT